MVKGIYKEFSFIRDLVDFLFKEDDLSENEFENKVDTFKNLSDEELLNMYDVKVVNNKYLIEERYL